MLKEHSKAFPKIMEKAEERLKKVGNINKDFATRFQFHWTLCSSALIIAKYLYISTGLY